VHSTGDGKWTVQTTNAAGTITGFWASAPNDVYAAVYSNVVLHSIGDGVWDHQMTAATQTFNAIWGSGPTDIYVVGPGAVHSVGNGVWEPRQRVTDGNTNSIWGTSATNIYVTQMPNDVAVFHSTGDGHWIGETTPTGVGAVAIWGADANHIYAGGSVLLFSTGNGVWTQDPLTIGADRIVAISGAGPNAVYVCTQQGYFYRGNGSGQWSAPEQVTGSGLCYDLWAAATNNIYLADTFGIIHGTY
jgi:hypothetical protein